jgi:nitrate reductase molybdenum cofactor assembly chaperone NarJ/NarW
MQTKPHSAPASWDLGAIYRVIAELLLNPEFRDEERIALDLAKIAPSEIRERIERFLDSPRALDVDEYTQTLELAPPCPLYLGAYIFDEPSSCRGAGASGRNHFMIEISALYAHFGFSVGDRELPDFVPVAAEFLAVSLDHPERDGVGLRRRLVDKQVRPGLSPLRKALQKYESIYDLLIEALELAVDEDLERMADDPVWLPPEVKETIPQRPKGAALNSMSGG